MKLLWRMSRIKPTNYSSASNDHHGHFWRNEYGEYGLAAQKTLVDGICKEVAAEGGSVLLLSGGDINTGVPESDLQDAEPDFRGMNLVGYRDGDR